MVHFLRSNSGEFYNTILDAVLVLVLINAQYNTRAGIGIGIDHVGGGQFFITQHYLPPSSPPLILNWTA